ncbi:MAG: glycine cleavage system protein GcvH [Planctomycetota bacterium]
MNIMSNEMFYSQTHEWARVEGDVVTVGITPFAAEHLSDLIFIQLPKAGGQVKQAAPFAEIESVKTVSDINSPISGQIAEVNDAVAGNLNAISTDALGTGWLIKVKMSSPDELKKLIAADAYKKLCDSESH